MTEPAILIERHPKAHTALLVEETVQAVTDDQSQIDPQFEQFAAQLGVVVKGEGVTPDHNRAKRYRQAAYAATAFEVGKLALPRMLKYYRQNGTLIPSTEFDITAYLTPESLAHYPALMLEALQGAYWLADSAEATLEALEDENRSAHALLHHLDLSTTDHYQALIAWKAGPGKNRWPVYNSTDIPEWKKNFISALCGNVLLSINLVTAKAIQHLIHVNPAADEQELDRAIAVAIPQIDWLASTNRHLGWRPDWEAAKKRGEHIGVAPDDSVNALLALPVSSIVEPNPHAASVEGLPIMRSPTFCPHASIEDGPLAKAGSCAGDPQVRYPKEAARAAARDFFADAGFIIEDDYFNFSSLALVMARLLVRSVILPVYREHYLEDHGSAHGALQ